MGHLRLLVNPAAGGGRSSRTLAAAAATLDALDADYSVAETTDLDDAGRRARAGIAAGDTIVAVGGDGLVGRLVGELRGAPVPLGLVPAGRGNDFARALGLPLDPRASARVLVEGREQLVDVGDVDGVPFAGVAIVGVDAEANRIANAMRLMPGGLVYVIAALRAVAAWRHESFRLTVDGEPHELRGFAIGIGNSGRYGGGMQTIPHAELDDGQLDVFLSGADSKLRLLRDLPKRYEGEHVDNPTIGFLRGRRVTVEADRPLPVYADGERIGELPIVVGVSPRSLRVLVPRA